MVLVAALALAGCSDASGDETAPKPSPTPSRAAGVPASYVAIGDSFTAAPYVPVTDLAGGCLRSSGNYPAILADQVGIDDLTDVSCSGAETKDVLHPQKVAGGQGTVPAQLDAVTRRTGLVTVSLGGNDHNVFGTLVQTCTALSGDDTSTTPCGDAMTKLWGDPEAVVASVGRAVARVLRAVHHRAPKARVVLVGYPRLVDPDLPCRSIPLATGDLTVVAGLERTLRDTLAAAAKDTGTEFLDMYAESAGHAICSSDPWVNGNRTDQTRAFAFHPFSAEQHAVAQRLAALLARG